MVFNRSFISSGSWSTNGKGGDVTFDTAMDPVVQAKVGISYVSTADAVLNRRVENPGWNFQSVRKAAHRTWSSLLGKVQIAGGTKAEQATFYTALYHSLLQPNVFNDVNGRVPGIQRKGPESRSGPEDRICELLGMGYLPERDSTPVAPGAEKDGRHDHVNAERRYADRSPPQVVGGRF